MLNSFRKSGKNIIMVRRIQESVELRQRCRKKSCIHRYHGGLQLALKPLLMGLQFLGLYYSIHCSKRWRRYGCVVFIGLTASFIHSLTVFEPGEVYGSILFGKIQWSLLCFESMLMSLLFLRGFRRGGSLELFFVRWDQTIGNQNIDRYKKRVVIAGVVALLLNVFVNFFGFLLSIYIEPDIGKIIARITWPTKKENNSLATNNSSAFYVGIDCNISCQERRNFSTATPSKPPIIHEDILGSVGKCFIIGLFTFNTAVNCAAVSLLVVLCTLVAEQFSQVTRRLIESITPQGRLLSDLGQLRYQHQRLIQLIETLDSGFSPVIALSFLINIVIFTLNFYNLIYFQQESGYHTMLFALWFITLVSLLASISVAAARVNSSAHRLLPYLYRVRSCDHTCDYQMEMLLFLSELTGRQIGLSVLRMFVVTWKTILTVVGLLITYFVLLIQFRGTSVKKNDGSMEMG